MDEITDSALLVSDFKALFYSSGLKVPKSGVHIYSDTFLSKDYLLFRQFYFCFRTLRPSFMRFYVGVCS